MRRIIRDKEKKCATGWIEKGKKRKVAEREREIMRGYNKKES